MRSGKDKINVVVLGSTGTIGVNALDVISRFPKRFRVVGLTANNNIDLLQKQVRAFRPEAIVVGEAAAGKLRNAGLPQGVRLLSGEDGLCELVSRPQVHRVIIGISGSVALKPFLAAIRARKIIAPANKEALVIAGDIIMREARRYHVKVIPVDSEQSAIFQCLENNQGAPVRRILLTASGGVLRCLPRRRFDRLTVRQILRHPRWRMGRKITVDSATLMNKGFELIEACRLFGLTPRQIDVLIHPEAIIHSMVEFCDHSIIGQMAVPDMRLPLQYALTYPERWEAPVVPTDFVKLGQLTFEKPDYRKFPSLVLARAVAERGGTYPAVLNAGDEMAVEAFLNGRIRFTQIDEVNEKVVARHRSCGRPELTDIFAADRWAREEASAIIGRMKK